MTGQEVKGYGVGLKTGLQPKKNNNKLQVGTSSGNLCKETVKMTIFEQYQYFGH